MGAIKMEGSVQPFLYTVAVHNDDETLTIVRIVKALCRRQAADQYRAALSETWRREVGYGLTISVRGPHRKRELAEVDDIEESHRKMTKEDVFAV